MRSQSFPFVFQFLTATVVHYSYEQSPLKGTKYLFVPIHV
jgi:hypothetical protein